MADQKDTIYIDIDDEITTIIEKVRGSQQKIVALVLPKRASVLQSIVNMKLLKRTADTAKKSLVLITTEAGLLPLAGTVGLYVARNLQTKPEIPTVDSDGSDDIESVDEPEDEVDFDPDTAADKPVGDLAVSSSVPLVGKAAKTPDAIETLELDDDSEPDAPVPAGKTPKAAKPKKDKKLAVPNFEIFRKKLFLIIPAVVAVLIVLVMVASALPKAEIVISTDTSNVNSNLAVTIDTGLKTANLAKQTIPATLQKLDKSGSQQVASTGKKNNGVKATGKVTLSLPDCSVSQVTVPAGTGVTANGLTFITQADANLQSVQIGQTCKNSQFPDFSTASVNVSAQVGGAQYNIGASSFKVSGYPGVAASSSSAMVGGTDNIVQVVAQSDIDSATQKITAQNSDSVKQQLRDQLKQAHLFPIETTFTAGTPNTTASSKAGDEASTVSVSQTTTYTMFGVKEDDLKKLVDADIKDKIDPSKQSILDEGLSKAVFKVNSASATGAQLSISTVATAGPDLNADKLKTQLAGLKAGEVRDQLTASPGVRDVQVHLSPFWVTSVPKKADKVTITFQKSKE
jgi:hypothetical protein